MSFVYTPEQEAIRELVRDYAEKEIAPRAAQMDKDERMDPEILAALGEMGLMGLGVPEEYGGLGMGMMEKYIVVEELAKVDASVAEVISVHNMAYTAILLHGSDYLKEKYLTKAAEGAIAAFALTEPSAGSDAAAITTKAVLDGDEYVLNGTKCFISNMGPTEGDFVTVLAITDPAAGVRGFSAFVVDRDTPGMTIGKREEKLGIRAADVSEIIFEDCRIPKENLVGELGRGFKDFMEALDGGRIGIAAQALGIAEEALHQSVKYVNERVQFGKPIAKLQGIQWYLADMTTKVEAARALIPEAAADLDRGESVTKMAAIAKYYASETAVEVVDRALQIHGGYGYMRDYPIEKMYRDVRITPIYEGSNEVMKAVIAREALRG